MQADIIIPNECSIDKISSDCIPIVNAAIEAYRRVLDKLLVSIRLIGSVARGESVFGVSDIEFAGLVLMNPDAHQRDSIATDSRRLTRNYQCISVVDLKIEIKGRVEPQLEFILWTDSVCVWGADSYTSNEAKVSNVSLAKLTTPDFNSLIAGFRQRLRGTLNTEELGQLGRLIGKEVLKCFRKYLVLRFGVYRKNISDICNQLLMYFPKYSETLSCLLRIYEQPVERKEELLEILKMAQASYMSLEKDSV
jgi:hypothetical protein